VILATRDLVHQVSNADGSVSFPSALADSEWAALAKFEATFGIRQFSDSTLPSAIHGLNPPTNAGEQGGNTGRLTAAGLAVFPYLKGAVPIDNPTAKTDTFGYRATPAAQAAPAAFQTLLSGPDGASHLGIYTHADGREEMVSTLDGNENQLHEQLLRHGILDWRKQKPLRERREPSSAIRSGIRSRPTALRREGAHQGGHEQHERDAEHGQHASDGGGELQRDAGLGYR
jgi:hypothetical protein